MKSGFIQEKPRNTSHLFYPVHIILLVDPPADPVLPLSVTISSFDDLCIFVNTVCRNAASTGERG